MGKATYTDHERCLLAAADPITAVQVEMTVQDRTWGAAEDRDLSLPDWMTVLGEEFGEACRGILGWRFHRDFQMADDYENLRHELIQIAALALQMTVVLDFDRHSGVLPYRVNPEICADV